MKIQNMWNVLVPGLALMTSVASVFAAETPTSANSASTTITTAPAGLAFNSYNVGALFKTNDTLAFGPKAAFSTYSENGNSGTGFGLGMEALVALGSKTFESGWVLLPSIEYASASSNGKSVGGMTIGADIGYWWFMKSGFNVGVGAGAQYVSLNFEDIGLGSIGGVIPSLMSKVGYSF